jgi:hypothetical protein
MKRRSVPFEIPNVNHGFVVVKGLFHLRDGKIVLEFDERDGFVGFMKSEIKELEVPFSEIDSISGKRKWFSYKVEITAKSMKTFRDIPGAEQGKLTLKVQRKDRDLAGEVVSTGRLKLSEFRLDELDKD